MKADWHHLYTTSRWLALRTKRLNAEPLCRMHATRNKVVAADTVDHVTPHKGDEALFFDYGNTQALCKPCHDSTKQGIERRGYDKSVGTDGYPTDPKHPFNAVR